MAGKESLRLSQNDWDWLGTGIYFWENSAKRALDWATFAKQHPKLLKVPVKQPFVIGAIIDLGNCLDLLEATSIRVVEETYKEMCELFATLGTPLPIN